MDLDNLKIQFNKELSSAKTKDERTLVDILQRDSISVIDKISRSLRWEIMLSIFLTICAGIAAVLISYPSIKIYCSVFVMIGLAFIVVLYNLSKKISHSKNNTLPVKQNIQETLQLIKNYVRISYSINAALVPAFLIFAFYLRVYDDSLPTLLFTATNTFWLIIYAIALAALGIFLSKKYMDSLYGKHIRKLEENLSNFE